MSEEMFRAMVVEQVGENKFERSIKRRSIEDLPPGDVLVKVLYSSLNYKDALSAHGNRGVTRNYPHTPGVDASGVIAESTSPGFSVGEEVLVHAYDLGCNTSGGFGEYIRVPANWVIKVPTNLSIRESMIYGSAGFTSAYCVLELENNGLTPDKGEILVTGATGGVGSVAVAMLAELGFQVAASTGKTSQKQFLHDLGAKEVISRQESTDESGRLLLKGRWAGVVDTVGGDILATAIRATKPMGVVTCCGNVASSNLPLNVYPFILRGVKLIGIDSQNCPMDIRERIWNKIAEEWKISQLDNLANEISLDELDENIELILQGKHKGRVLVDLTR